MIAQYYKIVNKYENKKCIYHKVIYQNLLKPQSH